MSLAIFFEEKCLAALQENASLVLKKLSNPMDLFTVDMSDVLKQAASGDMGPLADYAEKYINTNSDKIALSLVQATGIEDELRGALNIIYNILAVAFLTYNTFALFLMKVVAKQIIERLETKKSRVTRIRDKLIQLHNVLGSLREGDPIYEAYLADLKEAYTLLAQAEVEVTLVRDNIVGSGLYLSSRYTRAQEVVKKAQELVRSPVAGGRMHFSAKNVLRAFGLPSTKEQKDNMIAVPSICSDIIGEMREYSAILASINGLIATYLAGVGLVSSALQDNLRRFANELLSQIIIDIKSVRINMDETIKGKVEKRINPITQNIETIRVPPNPARVTASALKWGVDLSMVTSRMKLLPGGALSSPALSAGRDDMAAFNASVNALKSMDSTSSGQARLDATDAQEQVTGLEQQLLTLMIQANAAVATTLVGDETMSLAKSMVSRMELTLKRDEDIRRTLQAFVDYPLEGEEVLQRIINAVNDALVKAGMDKALSLFQQGKLESFFKMHPKDATFVGAGLQAIALLKECFDTVEEQQEITKVQRELEREQDLLKLRISFDFDLAILRNLDLCLRVRGLSSNFKLKEFLCKIAEDTGVGSIFSSLNNVVGF